MQNKKTLICIVGATAIGKTALSIKIANHFSAEIISADSRQFYKEMNIGTAVPSSKELKSVKQFSNDDLLVKTAKYILIFDSIN